MKILFIIFWLFTLISCWVISSTTIVNGDNSAKTFKIKTFCFWISVLLSVFGGYYLK